MHILSINSFGLHAGDACPALWFFLLDYWRSISSASGLFAMREYFGTVSNRLGPLINAPDIDLVSLRVQHVRRAAVSALSTAAHNKPGLIKDLLPTLLPLLYDQTVIKVGSSSLYVSFN